MKKNIIFYVIIGVIVVFGVALDMITKHITMGVNTPIIEGIVSANELTALTDKDSLNKGCIKIENLVLNGAEKKYSEMLGKRVEAYYKNDKASNEKTVVCIFESKKNQEFTINGDKIIGFDVRSGEFRYKNEKETDVVRRRHCHRCRAG